MSKGDVRSQALWILGCTHYRVLPGHSAPAYVFLYKISLSICFSVAVIIDSDQKQPGEDKACFSLPSRFISKGSRDRN